MSRNGDDRVGGTVKKTSGHADDVSRQHEIDDLPLAVAQQLIAGGKALLDETQLAEFVTVHHQIAPLFDRQFGLHHGAQALQSGSVRSTKFRSPRDERIIAPDVLDRADRGSAVATGRTETFIFIIWINKGD